MLLGGCTIDRGGEVPATTTVVAEESPTSEPSSAPALPELFVAGGEFGAVLYDGSQSHTFGTLVSDVSWSTIKVPIALAAAAQGTADPGLVAAALQHSDNAAALSLWQSLGSDVQAAGVVQQHIAGLAPAPVVNSVPSRPGFSVFGQTTWPLASQAEYGYWLGCDPNAAIVTDNMGLVTPEQRDGLGQIPGMRFKGGWGPDPSGGYLVRQFGFVETPAGRFGVAIAARPTDGSYMSAQMMLDEVASQLQQRMVAGGALNCAELPR